ncbi:MAG: c-type cytochrome biogenesis protein CcsB, partial [Microlunatus sp.]|nr:c-type cytochrome biogenesis protein CcsB [Microlunatus sp.]
MNLEYYSSAALVTSVVIYLLAMTAHAAEWAAARRTPATAEPAELAAEAVETRKFAAVAAGSPKSGSATTASGPVDREDTNQTRLADLKIELWGRVGVALTVIGFGCSVVGVVLRGLAAGRP